MAVNFERKDNFVTFTFQNRMDTVKCMESEKEVIENIKDSDTVVFNMEGVEYIASSFLRLCGRAANIVDAGNFSIINVVPSVKKVFKIAGLVDRLNIK